MNELLNCTKNKKCNNELLKYVCCILASNNRASCKYFIKEFKECLDKFK